MTTTVPKRSVAQQQTETCQQIPKTPLRFLVFMLRRHPWQVGAIYAAIILAFGTEGFFPLFVKQLVDASLSFSGEIRRIWLWGLGIFAAYAFYALWLRISGYMGLKLIVLLKAEIYRLFMRYLPATEFNDEPGAIIQSVALIGEGSELLLLKSFWHSSGFVLNFLIHLSLILSTHYYIFGIFCGWILLHLVSNSFLVKWRKKFTVQYQQSTSAFKGHLVGFARNLIYEPERRVYNQLSEDMYVLDRSLKTRTANQLVDWNVGETIHLIYNFIHGFFIICSLILILVLWQDRLISTGDIAMSMGIMLSTQKMLKDTSSLMNLLTDAYAQVETGLQYMHSKQQKGLMPPRFF